MRQHASSTQHGLRIAALLAAVAVAGCGSIPGMGSGKSETAAAPAAAPAGPKIGPGMNERGEVVDAKKVEAGYGQKVKGLNDWEGEITGKPAPGSKFAQLKIGMPMKQVMDIVGTAHRPGLLHDRQGLDPVQLRRRPLPPRGGLQGPGPADLRRRGGLRLQRQPDLDHPQRHRSPATADACSSRQRSRQWPLGRQPVGAGVGSSPPWAAAAPSRYHLPCPVWTCLRLPGRCSGPSRGTDPAGAAARRLQPAARVRRGRLRRGAARRSARPPTSASSTPISATTPTAASCAACATKSCCPPARRATGRSGWWASRSAASARWATRCATAPRSTACWRWRPTWDRGG